MRGSGSPRKLGRAADPTHAAPGIGVGIENTLRAAPNMVGIEPAEQNKANALLLLAATVEAAPPSSVPGAILRRPWDQSASSSTCCELSSCLGLEVWRHGDMAAWRHGCLVGVLLTRALDCGVEPHRIAIAATPGQGTSIASHLCSNINSCQNCPWQRRPPAPSNAMFVLLSAAMTCPAVVCTFAESSPPKPRAEPFLLRAFGTNVCLGK
jgi:hypothetical protein